MDVREHLTADGKNPYREWLDTRHNPTQDTLNRLLKPFKLRLSLAPLPGKTRPNAA